MLQDVGIAMTGGGARGAYQAGVLKRIGEIPRLQNNHGPFQFIGGASAGAINSCALAAGAHQFGDCTKRMSDIWSNITPDDVFHSDLGSLVPKVGRWIKDLSLGSLGGGGNAHSLLDATPLRKFLQDNINLSLIRQNLKRGHVKALSVAATSYNTGKTYFFIESATPQKLWRKARRMAIQTEIDVDHICASAAIPIVFQPVSMTMEGVGDYFGDGCMRLPNPLSPVIRLGAKRILAIGVRSQKVEEATAIEEGRMGHPPSLAQVLGVILNTIFLDHLDTDVEHLQRLNGIIRQGGVGGSATSGADKVEPIQEIGVLSITPSHDLGELAHEYANNLPKTIRYLVAGLGTKQSPSSDLISYLLFDSAYTSHLARIGYEDAHARIAEIEQFLIG